jgi:hypothetical protein
MMASVPCSGHIASHGTWAGSAHGPFHVLFFSSMVEQPTVGLGLLNVEASRSHSDTTVGRTPLDEWSARNRDLYLTTHETHNRQTSTPPAGFELAIPASEWPQTHAFDRGATGNYTILILGQDNPVATLKKNDKCPSGKSCIWAKWTRKLPRKWSWPIANCINSCLEQ